MNFSVIGAGYVGLVTAVCFAAEGHRVICIDEDREKVEYIRQGRPHFYEKDLEDLLKSVLEKDRLAVSTSLEEAVLGTEFSFICVGTPSEADGKVDLSQVEKASIGIGKILGRKDGYHLMVVKSTVMPGTTEGVVIPILEDESGKNAGEGFGVCVNPEFLREGEAVHDFHHQEDVGIVVGELDERSGETLVEVYRDFEADILRTTLRSAEMIKYARNAYLAKDISFANEVANLCEKLDIDYLEVKKGMEMDRRIGSNSFLRAGAGFGGSCLPKDLRALASKTKELGFRDGVLEAALRINEEQPGRMLSLAEEALGSIDDMRIGVLGLAFKPWTDDMREASSLKIVKMLLKADAQVIVYDPKAMKNARKTFGDEVTYAESPEEALRDADACLIVTEWPEFSDITIYNSMKGRVIVDGRRIIDPSRLLGRFEYYGIGYPRGLDLA